MAIRTAENAIAPVGGFARDRARAAILIGFCAYLGFLAAAWWGVTHLAPDRLSLSLLGHTVALGDLHRRIADKGLVLATVMPAIFVAEIVLGGWSGSSLRHLIVRRSPSSLSDLACFALWQTPLMTVLAAGMSLGVALISGVWLHDRLREATGLTLSVAWAPVPVQVVSFYLIYSFLDYWNHRLDHTRRFWPLHRFHHAADDFCVLNSSRTHPAVFTGVVSATLPAALLAASPSVILDVSVFVVCLRYLIHSRIDSDFGWVGRTLVQSPNHHRLHHSLDTSEPTGHFSLLPLWDHLFGTWRGDADQSLAIGVDTPYRHGLWLGPDLWRDYRDFWSGLFGARRGPAES
jgi:sterol desaturase/sphingolipid hydroxylase (fatty acid hydroxylase superfamily)